MNLSNTFRLSRSIIRKSHVNTCDLWIKGQLNRNMLERFINDCRGATATVYFGGLICGSKQEVHGNIQHYKIQVYIVSTDVTTVCVASCIVCVEAVIGMNYQPCEDFFINPLKPELNLICYLLALLAHHFLHVSRIRVKSLTLRSLTLYIYGTPILDVSRSHTTTQQVGRTPLDE